MPDKNHKSVRPAVEILRQIHRWLALVLALSLLVIGITGAILQGIIVLYGEVKKGGGGLPASITPFHNLVYMIHTGAYMGIPSDFYGIICGLGLIYFSISGLWMYLNLRNSRVALGTKDLFWATKTGPDALWRTLHRWLTIVLVPFLAIIAFTGTAINGDYVLDSTYAAHGPKGNPLNNGLPIVPFGGTWHETNFNTHRLDFLGAAGHWIGVLAGAGLALFVVSGIYMYLALHARRAKSGRRGLFW